jgi:translation initiation factor 1
VYHEHLPLGAARGRQKRVMGKKNKPPAVPTSESSKLTHSPFAALSSRDIKPAASTPEATQPDAANSAPPAAPRSRGRLILRRETKHRGGKAVVIVSGFTGVPGFDDAAIAALAADCKRTLGCGGTVDDHEIVLQGDRPAEVAELLRSKGFRVSGVTS